MRTVKNLKLIGLLAGVDRWSIRADKLEEVGHDDATAPDVHRLEVVLLVDDHFGRSVESRRYPGRELPINVHDCLFNFVDVALDLVLKRFELERSQGPLIVHAVRDEVIQVLRCLWPAYIIWVYNVGSLPCETEVANLARAVFINQDIGWLKITMYHACRVHEFNSAEQIVHDRLDMVLCEVCLLAHHRQ